MPMVLHHQKDNDTEEDTNGEALPILGREQLLPPVLGRIARVELEERGGVMLLRNMTLADFQAYQDAEKTSESDSATIALALVFAACDEKGNRIFTVADVPAIVKTWDLARLMEVHERVLEINGLSDQVHEIVKKK